MPALRARQSREGSGSLNGIVARTGRALAALAGLLAAAASCALVPPAAAAAAASDRFVAGAAVTERTPVEGDLFAAAGSVDVEAPVAGDAVVAAGTVRLASDVRGSVYAAGGRVLLGGQVERNARLAGGRVQVEPSARIAGNLTITGGSVELRGPTEGSFGAAAGSVLIDAHVGGDVDVAARSVVLGPHARIDGSLRYRSGEPLQRDPAAQVTGPVEALGAGFPKEEAERPLRWLGTAFSVLWTLGLTLLAAIVVALLPRASASISAALRQRPGFALLLGFVVLVCTPIVVVLSFVTVIGIPLGLILLLVYLMLLPLAWVASAIGIGDMFVSLPASAGATGATPRRAVAAALSVVALALLSRVPWIGGWIAFVALMTGLGALALQLRRLRAS